MSSNKERVRSQSTEDQPQTNCGDKRLRRLEEKLQKKYPNSQIKVSKNAATLTHNDGSSITIELDRI